MTRPAPAYQCAGNVCQTGAKIEDTNRRELFLLNQSSGIVEDQGASAKSTICLFQDLQLIKQRLCIDIWPANEFRLTWIEFSRGSAPSIEYRASHRLDVRTWDGCLRPRLR